MTPVRQLLTLEVGDDIEFRWGKNGSWYRCRVSSLTPFDGRAKGATQLEFLRSKNRRSKGVRAFSTELVMAQLLADGDIALPGSHIEWE